MTTDYNKAMKAIDDAVQAIMAVHGMPAGDRQQLLDEAYKVIDAVYRTDID